MKTVDIEIGRIYAAVSSAQRGETFNTEPRRMQRRTYRRTRPTRADVNSGFDAAPVKALAIGKFRERPAGACTLEIVDDHYMTTVKVATVDVRASLGFTDANSRRDFPAGNNRIGYPAGLPLTSPDVVWNEEVFNAVDLVMPWEDFLKRRSELAFREMEITALQNKVVQIEQEMKAAAGVFMSAQDPDDGTWRYYTRDDDGYSYSRHDGASAATHLGVTTTTYYPLSEIDGFADLQEARADAVARLNCAI